MDYWLTLLNIDMKYIISVNGGKTPPLTLHRYDIKKPISLRKPDRANELEKYIANKKRFLSVLI